MSHKAGPRRSESPDTAFRDRIRHPQLRQLYDYWDGLRGARRFPARRDIDPVDLRFAVGSLTLVEVLRDPLRFRFRLAGSGFSHRFGMDFTGKTFDDVPDPAYRAQITEIFRRVAETGEPSASLNERILDGRPHKFETLRLPLSEDGLVVNMVLVCALYFDRPPTHPPLGKPGAGGFLAPKILDVS